MDKSKGSFVQRVIELFLYGLTSFVIVFYTFSAFSFYFFRQNISFITVYISSLFFLQYFLIKIKKYKNKIEKYFDFSDFIAICIYLTLLISFSGVFFFFRYADALDLFFSEMKVIFLPLELKQYDLISNIFYGTIFLTFISVLSVLFRELTFPIICISVNRILYTFLYSKILTHNIITLSLISVFLSLSVIYSFISGFEMRRKRRLKDWLNFIENLFKALLFYFIAALIKVYLL